MVTLTSTIFTYNKASEIILKKTVRQSQETVRQMSENYENFMQGIYDKINYIAYSAKQHRRNFVMVRRALMKKDDFRGKEN